MRFRLLTVFLFFWPAIVYAQTPPSGPNKIQPQQEVPADLRILGSALETLGAQVQSAIAAAQLMNERYAREIQTLRMEVQSKDDQARRLAEFWKTYVSGLKPVAAQ